MSSWSPARSAQALPLPTVVPFPDVTDAAVETLFQAGHGFTPAAPSTGSQADDSSVYIYGSQSLRLTTLGNGGVQATRKTGMPALDASSAYLCLALRIDHPERLASLRLDVSSDAFVNWSLGEQVSLSTNILSPFFVPNEWIVLLIPWGAFTVGGGAGATRSALTGFQIRLTDIGTGPVQLWVNKISTVAQPANAVCSFTFDDGFASHLTKAKPILDVAGFRAGFAPIVNKIGDTNYATLTQLQQLRDGGWEPMTHAYSIAVHDNYAASADGVVVADATAAKQWLRDNGFGPADSFLIPQGQLTDVARAQAFRQLFNFSRTAYTRQRETYPPARPWGTRSYTLSQAHLPADIQAKVDEAIASREWLIFEVHNIVDSNPTSTDYLTADLQTVVSYIVSQGLRVRTVGEVLQNGVT